MPITIPYNFTLREYQKPIWSALSSGYKRALWCVHRRAGKDLTLWNWVIKDLIVKKQICFYIFPTYSQAKKVIWNSQTKDGISFLDFIPKELIAKKSESELSITFYNGSYLQLIGSENIDRLVGTAPNICVFSEAALQEERAWNLIRPIVVENNGVVVFISTPRGKNWFYDLYNMARNNHEWFCEKLSIEDTKAITKEQVETEIKEGMSEQLARQEFYVSFIGMEGAYYIRELDKLRSKGQIGNVIFDPTSKVNTAWDIGVSKDSMAIVFFQQCGQEIHVIDAYDGGGEGWLHYANVIDRKAKDEGWIMGEHYAPHDIENRILGTTAPTRKALAAQLGINFITLPTLKMGFADGIECVRGLFPRIWIDENKCSKLIKALENYHKDYEEKSDTYTDKPAKFWANHLADSFRYMAIAVKNFTQSSTGLSLDKVYELNQRRRLRR